MNDFKHTSNNTAPISGDNFRRKQFCYSSLQFPQYFKHIPAYLRGINLTQFLSVKRLRIAIPELLLMGNVKLNHNLYVLAATCLIQKKRADYMHFLS